MLINLWLRPAMILIPLCAGAFFPQCHVMEGCIRWGLIFMLFMSYLRIQLNQLTPRKAHWYILALNFAMGIIPFLTIRALGPEYTSLAQSAFFIGITPTATAAPVIVSFLHGRVSFTVTGFLITNFFISLSFVFLIPFVTGSYSIEVVLNIFKNLALIIGLPLGMAAICRKFFPKSKNWPLKYNLLSLAVWSFQLFILSAIARQHFIDQPDESPSLVLAIVGIALIICILNFTLGKLVAPKRFKRECGQLLGQKNTTLSIYLALYFVHPLVALGPTFYILFHNAWNAYQMFQYGRHRIRRQKISARLKESHESCNIYTPVGTEVQTPLHNSGHC